MNCVGRWVEDHRQRVRISVRLVRQNDSNDHSMYDAGWRGTKRLPKTPRLVDGTSGCCRRALIGERRIQWLGLDDSAAAWKGGRMHSVCFVASTLSTNPRGGDTLWALQALGWPVNAQFGRFSTPLTGTDNKDVRS